MNFRGEPWVTILAVVASAAFAYAVVGLSRWWRRRRETLDARVQQLMLDGRMRRALDVARELEVSVGRVYPVLRELTDDGLLVCQVEPDALDVRGGRPVYRYRWRR